MSILFNEKTLWKSIASTRSKIMLSKIPATAGLTFQSANFECITEMLNFLIGNLRPSTIDGCG